MQSVNAKVKPRVSPATHRRPQQNPNASRTEMKGMNGTLRRKRAVKGRQRSADQITGCALINIKIV